MTSCTQQVAYETLLQERRRALHARIVEALEVLAGERVGGEVERLAYHALRGKVWDKAVTYGQQAGVRAYNRAVFRGAVASFEQALQALALAAALGDHALQAQACHLLGQVYAAIGDFGRAAELLRRSVGSDRLSTQVRIRSRAWLAYTLGELGAFAEGRRHGEEALRLATRERRGATPIIAHGCLGELHLGQGDLAPATRVLEQGLALCRASGNRLWVRRIVAGLGSAAVLQGRLAEGRALLEEAMSESLRTGALQHQAGWVAWLGEACRLAGRGEEALRYAHEAIDVAGQHKKRAHEAYALHQPGVVQAHADPPDVAQAEAHYQQALTLTEELGMRPLQADCHLGLGRLYRQIDRGAEARVALSTAIDLYRAMDMPFWLPEAEAALAQVRSGPKGSQTDNLAAAGV